jgi:hypothetical protein
MNELRGNIKITEMIQLEEITSEKEGSSVDSYLENNAGFHFDSILVRVGAGEMGADVDNVKFKVEESDDGSSWTVASGGAEVEVEDETTFQVKRSKRYLRVVATPTEVASPSGTEGEDVAFVYATGIFTNWSIPMPIL